MLKKQTKLCVFCASLHVAAFLQSKTKKQIVKQPFAHFIISNYCCDCFVNMSILDRL